MSADTRHDVAVIGGAIVGSCVAYFLKQLAPQCRVVVIEPDPTFAMASTLRASGGARRLFSCPENIEMSKFSIDFIEHAAQLLAVDGEAPAIEWRAGGYLFIVPRTGMDVLQANYLTQRSHGCAVDLLTTDALAARFPSMRVDDLGGGVFSPDDGWCDPNGLLQGLRRKLRELRVVLHADRVTGFEQRARCLLAAKLSNGQAIHAARFVNATGAWAGDLSALAGVPLPVAPQRRFEHFFTTPARLEPLPYVKDLDRLAFRPEGRGYSGGVVQSSEPLGYNFDIDHDYFDRTVWPALAHRFPALEAVRCERTWSGLYDQCVFDGNPIIGACGLLDNYYVAAGFSGHGMMHAPAAGRAIAELIVHGGFRTIDVARLGYARVAHNEPYPERGIL